MIPRVHKNLPPRQACSSTTPGPQKASSCMNPRAPLPIDKKANDNSNHFMDQSIFRSSSTKALNHMLLLKRNRNAEEHEAEQQSDNWPLATDYKPEGRIYEKNYTRKKTLRKWGKKGRRKAKIYIFMANWLDFFISYFPTLMMQAEKYLDFRGVPQTSKQGCYRYCSMYNIDIRENWATDSSRMMCSAKRDLQLKEYCVRMSKADKHLLSQRREGLGHISSLMYGPLDRCNICTWQTIEAKGLLFPLQESKPTSLKRFITKKVSSLGSLISNQRRWVPFCLLNSAATLQSVFDASCLPWRTIAAPVYGSFW